jgi:hypothetical protein
MRAGLWHDYWHVQLAMNWDVVDDWLEQAPFSSKGCPVVCWFSRQMHSPPAWHPIWTMFPVESVAWQPHWLPSVAQAGLPHEPSAPVPGAAGVPVPASMT